MQLFGLSKHDSGGRSYDRNKHIKPSLILKDIKIHLPFFREFSTFFASKRSIATDPQKAYFNIIIFSIYHSLSYQRQSKISRPLLVKTVQSNRTINNISMTSICIATSLSSKVNENSTDNKNKGESGFVDYTFYFDYTKIIL